MRSVAAAWPRAVLGLGALGLAMAAVNAASGRAELARLNVLSTVMLGLSYALDRRLRESAPPARCETRGLVPRRSRSTRFFRSAY